MSLRQLFTHELVTSHTLVPCHKFHGRIGCASCALQVPWVMGSILPLHAQPCRHFVIMTEMTIMSPGCDTMQTFTWQDDMFNWLTR